VQTRNPYSWPLRPQAKYRRGLPAPQHAWPGRGRSGRLGGWGVNWSCGCNRPCAPLVSGHNIAVCQDPGGPGRKAGPEHRSLNHPSPKRPNSKYPNRR
jgi:hypothetical protein